ncbi:hypothetical protein ACPUER_28685 [Burkholderia sp. DN3021]|uniref:hypothetical protein n=1 Tax=Burkholderia sp. DN3021 TaxID=3410137 RepID=UPI003C7EA13E
MDDPTDILIPLLPPFLALLRQAADAQARGERAAHDLWLAAAAHLHAVDADALAQLTSTLVARQRPPAPPPPAPNPPPGRAGAGPHIKKF